MIQTRKGIFETNSSSTHCLVVRAHEDYDNTHKIRLDAKGYINVNGWNQINNTVAYGFYEKLAYMLSWMYLRDYGYYPESEEDKFAYPSDDFDSTNEDDYKTILKVIKNHYPEVNGFQVNKVSDIEFDHQTAPDGYYCGFIIDIWNLEQLEGYLFNDDAVVVVGHD